MRELLGTTDEEMLFQTLDLVADGDAGGALRLVDELAEPGADLATLVTDLLGHLRALFLCQQLGDAARRGGADRRRAGAAAEQATGCTGHRARGWSTCCAT